MNFPAFRYGFAFLGVGAALGLRLAIEAQLGLGLPTYITFYPVVMVVAVLGGLGPGLLATVLSGLTVDYYIFPPIGQFSISSTIDQVGMAIFIAMGIFMSLVAELYRRNRSKAAAYDRDVVLLKSQEEIRESEARYRSLVEQTADGIFLADSQGHYIEVNSAGCIMLGYSREEILNLTFVDILDPTEIPRLSSQLVNLATGVLAVNEWKFLRKDGSTFIGEVRGKQLVNGNFQGILIDITQRIQTENSIRVKGQRLKAHIENSPLAVVTWDKDFNVTQWDGEAENIFGWSALETIGKSLMELNMVYEEDIPLVQMTMATIFSANQRYVISSNRNVTKDGRIIHCIWYNSILCDKDDALESVMSLVLDVTEQKQIEENIHQLAFYDALTNLPNRRLLDDRLEQNISACKRSRKYGAVMFLDLDNFKPLNDKHGHKAGDLLLVEVARRLLSCVREVDTVARFGGDEFVVLLNDLNEIESESRDQARVVAEKILSSLSQPYWLGSKNSVTSKIIYHETIGASIGVVLFNESSKAEKVLKHADHAMYEAKEGGRNKIKYHLGEAVL
jgi:diguanylate cyclase (GGDEF)-like protein/PAS domain S-box-containing protein